MSDTAILTVKDPSSSATLLELVHNLNSKIPDEHRDVFAVIVRSLNNGVKLASVPSSEILETIQEYVRNDTTDAVPQYWIREQKTVMTSAMWSWMSKNTKSHTNEIAGQFERGRVIKGGVIKALENIMEALSLSPTDMSGSQELIQMIKLTNQNLARHGEVTDASIAHAFTGATSPLLSVMGGIWEQLKRHYNNYHVTEGDEQEILVTHHVLDIIYKFVAQVFVSAGFAQRRVETRGVGGTQYRTYVFRDIKVDKGSNSYYVSWGDEPKICNCIDPRLQSCMGAIYELHQMMAANVKSDKEFAMNSVGVSSRTAFDVTTSHDVNRYITHYSAFTQANCAVPPESNDMVVSQYNIVHDRMRKTCLSALYLTALAIEVANLRSNFSKYCDFGTIVRDSVDRPITVANVISETSKLQGLNISTAVADNYRQKSVTNFGNAGELVNAVVDERRKSPVRRTEGQPSKSPTGRPMQLTH